MSVRPPLCPLPLLDDAYYNIASCGPSPLLCCRAGSRPRVSRSRSSLLREREVLEAKPVAAGVDSESGSESLSRLCDARLGGSPAHVDSSCGAL